jgi:hypothetical protein
VALVRASRSSYGKLVADTAHAAVPRQRLGRRICPINHWHCLVGRPCARRAPAAFWRQEMSRSRDRLPWPGPGRQRRQWQRQQQQHRGPISAKQCPHLQSWPATFDLKQNGASALCACRAGRDRRHTAAASSRRESGSAAAAAARQRARPPAEVVLRRAQLAATWTRAARTSRREIYVH